MLHISGEISMIVVLPNKIDGLKDIEAVLDKHTFGECTSPHFS
jgi:hypothetical protein